MRPARRQGPRKGPGAVPPLVIVTGDGRAGSGLHQNVRCGLRGQAHSAKAGPRRLTGARHLVDFTQTRPSGPRAERKGPLRGLCGSEKREACIWGWPERAREPEVPAPKRSLDGIHKAAPMAGPPRGPACYRKSKGAGLRPVPGCAPISPSQNALGSDEAEIGAAHHALLREERHPPVPPFSLSPTATRTQHLPPRLRAGRSVGQ